MKRGELIFIMILIIVIAALIVISLYLDVLFPTPTAKETVQTILQNAT
jgi:flagellar basal body-associated protein FliL